MFVLSLTVIEFEFMVDIEHDEKFPSQKSREMHAEYKANISGYDTSFDVTKWRTR